MTQRKTTGHCCPAVCQLRAFLGLAFRHKDYLPIPGDTPGPHTAAITLLGQGRSLAHHGQR